MSTTFYLDYTYGIYDYGLAISDSQRALFTGTFIGSTEQIAATIGLNVPIGGNHYFNVLLGDGIFNNLTATHPVHPDHWLLSFVALSSVPADHNLNEQIASGTDVVFTLTPFWRDLLNSEQY